MDSTILGGPGFLTTAWSVIHKAQDPKAPEYRASLDRLMNLYWRPIYWSIRLDWNQDREAAADLTQQYLATFIEKNLLLDVSASKGRFRAFVKATLKNFLLKAKRDAQAQKRAGPATILSLSAADLDRVEAEGGRQYPSPDDLFDKELMRAVLDDAFKDLEKHLASKGRRDHFDLFRRYYTAGITYEALAKETGIPVGDITTRLHEMRRLYRERVIDRLRDGVLNEEELAAEVRELLQS